MNTKSTKLLAITVASFCAMSAQAKDKKTEKHAKHEVKCSGVNACKGTGACAQAEHTCKGQNACKGQGWVNKATADECTKAGGKVVEG